MKQKGLWEKEQEQTEQSEPAWKDERSHRQRERDLDRIFERIFTDWQRGLATVELPFNDRYRRLITVPKAEAVQIGMYRRKGREVPRCGLLSGDVDY